MALEQSRISDSQLNIVMVGFFLGTTVILSPGTGAGRDAWLAIALGAIEAGFLLLPTLMLVERFKRHTWIQIAETVYGRFLGKLIALFFLWFFFHLASLVLRTFSDFFATAVMPETPRDVFAILIVMVCAFAIKNGLEPFARASQLLVPVIIVLFIFLTTVSLHDIKGTNFQPFFQTPFPKLLWAVQGVASTPFLQTVVFLMITPYTLLRNKFWSFPIFPILMTGFLLIILSFRIIGLLGANASLYLYPGYQTVRLMNIANIFTRLEILTAISFLFLGFIKITVLYYGTVLGVSQIFHLNSYKPLVIPIGILLIILERLNFPSSMENLFFQRQIFPVYALPFEVILPLATLVIALIRKLPEERDELSETKD